MFSRVNMSKFMQQELSVLKAMPNNEIDLTDIPPTQVQEWLGVERARFYRPLKQQLTVRVDADVLAWLKS